jgi:quaternary ammonium compound-resistance protein SugE
MNWIVLVVSGLMESVWATALGACDGFSKPIPIVVFIIGMLLSMSGLAYALRTLPTGTAYAVWVGIGAAATTSYAMVAGSEPASLLKILLIVVLIASVVGLKLVSDA